MGHPKVHNIAGLEWSTHRHIVGVAVGGYLFNPVSVLLYERYHPYFPRPREKRPSFPAVLTGVLSIGHKPQDGTTARQKRVSAYDLQESSHSTRELTGRLDFADAELGHLLHLAPDQHTRLLPFAFYRLVACWLVSKPSLGAWHGQRKSKSRLSL